MFWQQRQIPVEPPGDYGCAFEASSEPDGLAWSKILRYKAPAIGEIRDTMSEHLLRDELATVLKAAIEQGDKRTIAIIRLVQAALKERDEQIREDGGRHRISDEELVTMLATMAEQRHESRRRYEETGQLELAEREAEEIEVINRFLPPQMDREASEFAIDQIIAELGASKLKDIGRVMTELKSRYPGQMNFADVRKRLCDQLS